MKWITLLIVIIPIQLFAPPLNENHYTKVEEYQTYLKYIEYQRFINDIAYSESRLNPLIVNSIGCVGLFQFGKCARKATGSPLITSKDITYNASTKKRYLKNDSIWSIESQYSAMDSLIKINSNHLNKEISIYCGKYISNVLVTKSGIIAAAHLAGYSNVKKFLKSDGKHNPKDIYKTSILMYLDKFKSYEI